MTWNLWKANLGAWEVVYKKGVTMNEEGGSSAVQRVRLARRDASNLGVSISELGLTCLRQMRDAVEAGESELAWCLSDVWSSLGAGADCLFDAWAQLAAIEEKLP